MSTTPTPGFAGQDTATVSRPATATRSHAVPAVVLLTAVVAALLRLRYLHSPVTPDEGGFLAVAHQWSRGPSLYGHYWVDRPPLLIALFRLADLTGGLTALRVIGCVATAVTVVATGLAVRRVSGPGAAGHRAAGWAAVVVGALLVSPLVGAVPVNGELLAAPFVAIGVALTVQAVGERHGPRALLLGAGAGAAGASALLVKQNMLDVAVFAGVLLLAAWRTGHLPTSAVRRLVLALGSGATAAGVLILGAAWLAGTRPGHVLFAMYDFRLRAASVLRSVDHTGRVAHLHTLGLRELAALGVVPVAALVVLLCTRVRHARRSPLPSLAIATVAMGLFGVISVLLGGSYWSHYLVQLAVPTGLAAGLVAAWRPRLGAVVTVPVLLSALVAWSLGAGVRVPDSGERVGTAIAASSARGDSVVSLLGDGDLVEASGLTSPYPYLWSLPARTLDPHLAELARVLHGPHPPTWIVVRGAQTQAFVDRGPAGPAMRSSYHLVGDLCGRRVYVHNGTDRIAPRVAGPCLTTLAGSTDPQTRRSPR